MALKFCESCEARTGPRTLYCRKCGSPFEKTLRAFGHVISKPQATAKSESSVVVNNNFTFQGRNTKSISPSFYSDSCGEFNLNSNGAFEGLYGKDEAVSIIMSALDIY